MRVKMLAGNWKMNKLNRDLQPFFQAFTAARGRDGVDVLLALPATLLAEGARLASPLGIKIAAQNVHYAANGAFTGELSASMIKEVGATATLIGHSERRQFFGETDASVALKVKAALAADLQVIACVGETLAERDGGTTAAVVTRQVEAFLTGLSGLANLTVAYEPVWAIGTGRSATPEQAQEVHALIRRVVLGHFGQTASEALRILYGGSANPNNIGELISKKDIDGALVGGASLNPEDFARMVKAAESALSPT